MALQLETADQQGIERVVDAAAHEPGSSDWSMGAFFRFTDTIADGTVLIGKNNTTGNQRSYLWTIKLVSGDAELAIALSDDGEAAGVYILNTTDADLQVGRWYHLGVQWDFSAQLIDFYKDGVLLTNGTPSGTWPSPSLFDGTAKLEWGKTNNGTTIENDYDVERSFIDAQLQTTSDWLLLAQGNNPLRVFGYEPTGGNWSFFVDGDDDNQSPLGLLVDNGLDTVTVIGGPAAGGGTLEALRLVREFV